MYWKKSCLIAIMAIFMVASFAYADDSFGTLTGTLTTAEAGGFGIGYLGGFIGLGDDATSIFGTVRYGFSDYTDGTFKFGFSDPDGSDSDPKMMLGVDIKYQFMDYNSKSRRQPLDMSIGTFFEYIDYGHVTLLDLGGSLIGSIPYRFEGGQRLIPYGRLNFRLERISNGGSESNFQAGLNLGAKFEFTEDIGLFGEFQIDGNTAFFTGVEFRAF
jgi:hypothetical protein